MLFSFHGFSLSEFLCRNNTTNDRDVLGLFLSVFSSCLLFTEQISGARSDRTRASSCVCLSPVPPPIPDHRGVDLISNALHSLGSGIERTDAVGNAIGYAKFRSRSNDAVIRVYGEPGKVIETHQHEGDFREP